MTHSNMNHSSACLSPTLHCCLFFFFLQAGNSLACEHYACDITHAPVARAQMMMIKRAAYRGVSRSSARPTRPCRRREQKAAPWQETLFQPICTRSLIHNENYILACQVPGHKTNFNGVTCCLAAIHSRAQAHK